MFPTLNIHSNVPFGIPKLDASGKLSLNQLPTSSQQLLGYFDASGGQNPSEVYPSEVFVSGDTYIVSVEGTITVYSPVTLTPSATLVTVGGLLQYITGSVTNPTGWYFVAAVATTQASQVGFAPAGSIGATNVQDAIVELDGDVITNSNDIFTLQGDYNSLVAADAGLQSQITDNADAIAGLGSPAAADVTFVPSGTIVATNVQNALQELDGDKLAIAGGTMTGILSSNKFKNGISGTTANNFLLDASANNGTMKLARESGQDIITVDAAGKVAFPHMPLSGTSPIIESGSNANGYYAKFADGTMLCTHSISHTSLTTASAFSWTYPAPMDGGMVAPNVQLVAGNSSNYKIGLESLDTTKLTGFVFNTAAQAGVVLFFSAMGRWK